MGVWPAFCGVQVLFRALFFIFYFLFFQVCSFLLFSCLLCILPPWQMLEKRGKDMYQGYPPSVACSKSYSLHVREHADAHQC